MGTYITNAKAKEALKAIVKVYDVDGTYDSTVLDEDIQAVEGTINSYVASRYPVPVTGAAALAMVEGFAVYLLRARGYGRLAAVETPAIVMSNAKAARQALSDIASGRLRLGDTSESTDTRISATFYTESEDVQMDRASLKGY